jgi:hypothetical protein
MVLSKLDLAIMAVIAGVLLWIEHENRIVVATPAAAEAAPPGASVCPESDSVPFSPDCLAFIEGHPAFAVRALSVKATATDDAPAASSGAQQRTESTAAAPCPTSNENAPYSARCLSFLSGWYWHPNLTKRAP